METHYNKLFAIHKQLMKREIPEDVVPIFFEYLGDLNETSKDLVNKQCFYLIRFTQPYWINFEQNGENVRRKFFVDEDFGHYCSICDKIYFIDTQHQMKNHTLKKGHIKKLKLEKDPTDISRHHIQKLFYHKHKTLFSKPKKQAEQMINSIKLEKITLK